MSTRTKRLGTFFPDGAPAQAPVDVAVVMTTVLRSVILDAVGSIYQQTFAGRIQVLIGVDKPLGPVEPLLELLAKRPPNVSALLLTLPYSTSVRHGGVHTAFDGGALRAILTFMANSKYVAYLDDDNRWLPVHLQSLLDAVNGKVWAYSQRMLVDQTTGLDLGVDRWDSVGVNKGRFADQGGFVDPNCLLIDKVACAQLIGRWAETARGGHRFTADRLFFYAIRNDPHGRVDMPTVRYGVRDTNILHKLMRDNITY
jgi:hypothetical protein